MYFLVFRKSMRLEFVPVANKEVWYIYFSPAACQFTRTCKLPYMFLLRIWGSWFDCKLDKQSGVNIQLITNMSAGWHAISKPWHLSKTECSPYWSTSHGWSWAERMWCIIWSFNKLPSSYILGCILLQVILMTYVCDLLSGNCIWLLSNLYLQPAQGWLLVCNDCFMSSYR